MGFIQDNSTSAEAVVAMDVSGGAMDCGMIAMDGNGAITIVGGGAMDGRKVATAPLFTTAMSPPPFVTCPPPPTSHPMLIVTFSSLL